MIRRPPRSTLDRSSAASDVYKRQPRDGLMTGLTKKTQFPFALIRGTLEILAVISGWYLGGTVGFGTLIFAFGIGPAVALGIYIVDKASK